LSSATLRASPVSIDFGSVGVSSAGTAHTVTITNGGTGPTGVLTVSEGAALGMFPITGDTCTGTLAPSQTCTFTVSFAPTGAAAAFITNYIVVTDGVQATSVTVVGGASAGSSIATDGGADGGPASNDNHACEQQLLTEWQSAPPAVGMGSKSSSNSYDTVIGNLMASNAIPGGALAVTRNGQLVLARAFGFADRDSHQPAHPGQLFRLASMSKQITAVGVLQLVEAGTLSLDASAFSYLPNLQPLPGKTINPQLSTITIRNLLNHTGGWNWGTEAVRNPTDDSMQIAAALGEPGPVSANDTIRYMLDKPITYSPGTTYCYSNFGYAVLGAIIEQVTGTAYPEWIQQHVLTPRGITDMVIGGSLRSQAIPEEVTYYDYPNAPLATSIFPSVPGPVPAPYGALNLQAGEACGGWIASPVDMLRFAGGIDTYVGPPSLISSSILSQMLANPNLPSCNSDGTTNPASATSWYGFGFFVDQSGKYYHGGSLPGTATEDVVGTNGFNVAVMFNSLPQNASQFIWIDLDQALTAAFGAAGTWTSEDYFDQFASFSDWQSSSAFAAQSLTAQASGKYPARVEGRLNGGSLEFRGEFVPLHTLTQVQSSAGLDCVSYRALAAQYQQAGLGLVSLQTFVDTEDATRYQATWKSF